jgi:GTP cyclohydrolase III
MINTTGLTHPALDKITRITPSMNCEQRRQMRHHLRAYLPVRVAMVAGSGPRVPHESVH